MEGFPCTIGGGIGDLDPRDYMDRKSARRMARFAQLAVAAALEAGSRTTFDRGAMRLDPLLIPRALPNMAAANIAMRFGLLGRTSTVATACAAGTHVIGEAAEVIRLGQADIVVTGGCEAGFCQLALGDAARSTAISSTKSMIGPLFGTAGGPESIAAVRTITDGRIHPTINYRTPDPECDLDYVPNEAREADARVALKNSFGFGGRNGCLIFRRVD